MSPRSILAVTDFSLHGDNALDRAALLSAAHGAVLKLAYLAYPGEAPPAAAATRLGHHALQLSQAHGIEARAASRLADTARDLLADVSAADLVVWGTAPVRSLRSFFLGQPVEELMRSARRPVLVARRRARHVYRKLLVAVDFSAASRALVPLSLSLGKAAPIELVHAVSRTNEGKLRYAEVSERVIRTYREQCRRQAEERMSWFIESLDAGPHGMPSAITHGDPSRQVLLQGQRSAADLIVVGKHPASGFSDLLFGSVASRLLNLSELGDAGTDVLVVPHDWEPASSSSAASRLAEERVAQHRVRAGAPPAPRGPNPASLRAGT